MDVKFNFNHNHVKNLRRGLESISDNKNVYFSLSLLNKNQLASLIKDISHFKFRKAKAITGNSVSQDFDVCFPAPRINSLEKLASLLEKLFSESLSEIDNPPIKPPCFNDLAIQKYHKNSSGISPHRDHKKYTGVIVIVTLKGESQLSICENRNGVNTEVINDKPGRIVILPATNFITLSGDNLRPLHFVDNIHKGRLSIGLRQNSEIPF